MRVMIVAVMLAFAACAVRAGDAPSDRRTVVVTKLQGDVSVRHGVTEIWTHVAVGDVLRPDDTMKTGKKSSAMLVTRDGQTDNGAGKKIALPAEVVVDISDMRDLSQEELMLKLTMEKVRSSSYQWKNEEMHIPNATVVHGGDRKPSAPLSENELRFGIFQWNGTRVLFDNGFYSTCALRAMEVFRLYPTLGQNFDNRLLVADALEKANLRGEARSEYGIIAAMPGLSTDQQSVVSGRMNQLKK